MDGENICIFAYGQTGAGKTFTMEGPTWNDITQINEMSGIIPRTGQFMFEEINRIKQTYSRDYRLEISSLEIYCETLRDLYGQDKELNLNLIASKGKVIISG